MIGVVRISLMTLIMRLTMTAMIDDSSPVKDVRNSTVLALARCGDDGESFAVFAAGLARELGLTLDFIESCKEPPTSLAECFVIGPAASADVLDAREARIEQATAAARAGFDAAVNASGAAARWTAVTDLFAEDEIWRRARSAAFLLLSRPRPSHVAQSLAEHILLRSDTPVLIVPQTPPQRVTFSTILCAWDGSRQARRALRAGMPFLRRAAKVQLVQVDGAVPQGSGAETLDHIADELAADGIRTEATLLKPGAAGIAVTLLDCCARSRSDLLVMGAYRHLRLRELILGGVTRIALERAVIPILMAH
ncbi:universal stress protein [Sphingomonas oligophenolica]|uniref:Universal stress protein n=1 Tax=Sphingomonas oligophenolica TaxID=301154 RepID=A0ABU9XWZ1_9SPHN